MNQQSGATSGRVANSIDVPSVDDFSKKISTVGCKIVRPKMTIPGIGYLAICEDTDGNSFGIIQHDRNARIDRKNMSSLPSQVGKMKAV
jgi:uncharacterized protein